MAGRNRFFGWQFLPCFHWPSAKNSFISMADTDHMIDGVHLCFRHHYDWAFICSPNRTPAVRLEYKLCTHMIYLERGAWTSLLYVECRSCIRPSTHRPRRLSGSACPNPPSGVPRASRQTPHLRHPQRLLLVTRQHRWPFLPIAYLCMSCFLWRCCGLF